MFYLTAQIVSLIIALAAGYMLGYRVRIRHERQMTSSLVLGEYDTVDLVVRPDEVEVESRV